VNRRSVGTGRTTPKGSARGSRAPTASGRYTPPAPRRDRPSPRIVPVAMFLLLLSGAVVIVVNYLGLLPTESGEASNWYLLLGLGLISGGFVIATQYR
jgi:Cell division protein CrgA